MKAMTQPQLAPDQLPLTANASSSQTQLVAIPFRRLALITVALPLGAFLFCIVYSYHFNFAKSTETHCNVWNFAPSISSAIGFVRPQSYVWRTCIALHAAPRLLLALLYRNYYSLGTRGRNKRMVTAAFVSNIVENLGLLTLTFASSKDDYTIHKLGFILFLSCSSLYLLLSLLIVKYLWWGVRNDLELRSVRIKRNIVALYFATLALAMYLFYRHNSLCEAGVYSLFSLCEYLVVLLNMAFHVTSYLDFHSRVIHM